MGEQVSSKPYLLPFFIAFVVRLFAFLLFSELKKTEIELLKEKELSSRSTSLDQIEPIASPNEEDSEDGLSDSDSEKALEEGEIQSE